MICGFIGCFDVFWKIIYVIKYKIISYNYCLFEVSSVLFMDLVYGWKCI